MPAKVRISGLRGYVGLARDLGGDPGKLTRDCGIDLALLDEEDALIPYRQLIQLLEHTASALAQPDFGLRLAARQDISVLGSLAVAMQNSLTVEDAMRCAATYLFVQSPALTLAIDPLADSVRMRLSIRLRNMPHQQMRQAEDLGIGVTHAVLSLLAQENYELLRVELPHQPLCARSVYCNYFNAPVTFGFAENAIYVTPKTLSAGLAGRSEILHKMAAAYLDVQTPSADGLFTGRVETALCRTLGTDSCNRASIAKAMAIHPRTLQRHLQQEGETFDAVRDRVRRERAEYYLCRSNLPLSQVAGIIGYTEQAVLSRSCRRWFGRTPREMRRSAKANDTD